MLLLVNAHWGAGLSLVAACFSSEQFLFEDFGADQRTQLMKGEEYE
jgi:hypothetical protein